MHTLQLVFSIEAQVRIYWSCSNLLLYTVHLKQHLITSLKLITTLCACVAEVRIHMHSPAYIHLT